MRDSIAIQCAELVGLQLLSERYAKKSNIPVEKPIAFITVFLKSIGLSVKTHRSGKPDRLRHLEIRIPGPMASRLNLDTRSRKNILRDKALELKSKGHGYSKIAKELELKSKGHARRLLKT